MENVPLTLRRLGALVLAFLVALFVLRPNWDLSGAPDLPAALTDVSFWLFWVGTLVIVAAIGYAFGWIITQRDVWLAVFVTGLFLIVNGFFTQERTSLTIFGVVVAGVGAMSYWLRKAPVPEFSSS